MLKALDHLEEWLIAFLLFVNIILLLASNVMEPSSIVLIMAPILFPVEPRYRSYSLRHPHGGEHGGRHVPPAGGG